MNAPLLDIRGLEVEFTTRERGVRVINGLDLEVLPGESVGLIGETGCGKSVTALSVLGLLPASARTTAGCIDFAGQDVLRLPAAARERLRGTAISMIFQEPMTSLDPSFTVGSQFAEVLATHRRLGGAAADAEALRLLELVRIPHAKRVLKQYPFELSGGMRQRVLIAIALSCSPRLLLADEPTTALDVTVQAQILALLDQLQRETGTAVLLITHDLGVVAETCRRTYVMYAGRVVEWAPTDAVIDTPLHPYTRGLLGALPSADPSQTRLNAIPGELPAPGELTQGCPFAPRCAHAMVRCHEDLPPVYQPDAEHGVACFLYEHA